MFDRKSSADFVSWLKEQPQRNDPSKHYSDVTINAAVSKLQHGLKTLGIPGYEGVDCFTIQDVDTFRKLHKDCYAAATEYDKAQGHSDFRNGLDFYLQFLVEADEAMKNSDISKKIRFIIAHYKANFVTVNKQERYKWEALKWYKDHWDIEAPNFAQMLINAFSKTGNLLASGMYYPYKMIAEYAKADPEAVRKIFRVLHDEQRPLADRYQIFKQSCQGYIDGILQGNPGRKKSLNHYQDPRAVMVYLTFQYPEKYYLFKSTMYTTFRERIGFVEPKTSNKSVMQKVENYMQMCGVILEEIQKDDQLISLHRGRLDATCYQDPELHLLTMDVIFYGSNYMSEDLFASGEHYWPPLRDYNPGITEEMWLSILQDKSITSDEALSLLNMFMKLGGESSFNNIAAHFGNQFYYKGTLQEFSNRVISKVNCAACPKEYKEFAKYIIPFVGRMIMDGDIKRESWKLRDELKTALERLEQSDIDSGENGDEENMMPKIDIGLNTILYGPPGTGKTYHTVIYAVAIIENKELERVKAEPYGDVLVRYNEYRAQGRIEFTTFHQSYGYEEFIEGIKPIVSEGDCNQVQYRVEAGIFKRFCELASNEGNSFDDAWTALVVAAKKEGGKYTFTRRTGSELTAELRDDDSFVVKWKGETQTQNVLRKAKALEQWNRGDYSYRNTLTGGTKWEFDAIQAIIDTLSQKFSLKKPDKIVPENQNYVFIIDEINRGNISKVFGELITLIEESKRVGKSEGMRTLLPYSMKPFGVPENVYIIGTMNTADRSIAMLDTALRRRFAFKEMLPDPEVLAETTVGTLSMKEMLNRMNRRIAILYDREHTIGHAYFLPLRGNSSIEMLADIFRNKVIPLLQEYFYEDYEKIRLVLGDNQKKDERDQFVLAKKIRQSDLFGNADIGLDDSFTYEINEDAFMNLEAYRQI